jgi:hypothetical protein
LDGYGKVCIYLRGTYAGVSKQYLHDTRVYALF